VTLRPRVLEEGVLASGVELTLLLREVKLDITSNGYLVTPAALERAVVDTEGPVPDPVSLLVLLPHPRCDPSDPGLLNLGPRVHLRSHIGPGCLKKDQICTEGPIVPACVRPSVIIYYSEEEEETQ
jgi:hypothetical protein